MKERFQLSDIMVGDHSFPKISIVTPNYNYGRFLEETIRSIVLQDYPNLEYIIIDGGSTDNSIEIIKKYSKYLTYWISEPDNGLFDALNKGFKFTTGEIMGWLNSDDLYMPGTLWLIGAIFSRFSNVEWITGIGAKWNEYGIITKVGPNIIRRPQKWIASGLYDSKIFPFITQEVTFWRRSLWEKAGGYLNTSYPLAADYELWTRFARDSGLFYVQALLGGLREHPQQRSRVYGDRYFAEVHQIQAKLPHSVLRLLAHQVSYLFHIAHSLFNLLLRKHGSVYAYNIKHKDWGS